MTVFFIEGSVLGLTAGISCMFYCLPVLFGLSSRDINNITAITNVAFLIIGRLISYVFIGLIFSVIGMNLGSLLKIEFIFKLATGALLIFWGIRGFAETESEKKGKKCPAKKFKKTFPFLTGIMTGLSPCPPFIAGITRVISMADIAGGILYFTGFFFSTTIFILPGFFTGLIKFKFELKIISTVISLIFGLFFLAAGIISLWNNYGL